jgi:hypothetical protein
MTNATCSLPDCENPIKRRGFCYSHYMKAWRYGTPTPAFAPAWIDIRGQRFGTVVVIERHEMSWLVRCDCGRERIAAAGELNRTGDATTCGHRATHYRLDDAGYSAAHQRVRQDRGHIRQHSCIECGGQARHWSYDHDDPDERLAHGLSARPVAYSLDPSHYSPRCVPCHKAFDLGRIDAMKA